MVELTYQKFAVNEVTKVHTAQKRHETLVYLLTAQCSLNYDLGYVQPCISHKNPFFLRSPTKIHLYDFFNKNIYVLCLGAVLKCAEACDCRKQQAIFSSPTTKNFPF